MKEAMKYKKTVKLNKEKKKYFFYFNLEIFVVACEYKK